MEVAGVEERAELDRLLARGGRAGVRATGTLPLHRDCSIPIGLRRRLGVRAELVRPAVRQLAGLPPEAGGAVARPIAAHVPGVLVSRSTGHRPVASSRVSTPR